MKIPKKINDLRRKLMRGLTSNVGHSYTKRKKDQTIGIEVKRVLISRPNGRLGNLLLITPLVQDVVSLFPDCKIDLFVKGQVAPIIFRNYENVDQIIQLPAKPFKFLGNYILQWFALKKHTYDLIINVDKDSSSGRLSSQFASSHYKIFGPIDEKVPAADYNHIAKNPIYNFRKYISYLGFYVNDKPLPLLDLKLTSFEITRGKSALDKITDSNKKTICLFTYATGAKCYAASFWDEFYTILQKKYSSYNFIEILPMHGAAHFAEKMPLFYSKDIREIGSLLNNTNIFIGADSGMMHLASAAQTTVIGLFGVTSPEKYEPYGNHSIAIDTRTGNFDLWFKYIDRVIKQADLDQKNKDENEATA